MSALRFTKDHEWLRAEGDVFTVGITAYAQKQLGDVVFVDLPALGRAVEAGKEAAVVESVKAASEVYAPIDGTITEINGELATAPSLVNEDPLGKGWFFRLKAKNPDPIAHLMDEAAYQNYLKDLG